MDIWVVPIFDAYEECNYEHLGTSLCLSFQGTAKLHTKATASFHIPTSNTWEFQFLPIFINACYCLFYYNYACGCEVFHYGFDLCFHNDWWHWTSFRVLVGHLHIFLGGMPMYILCWFLNCFVFLYLSYKTNLHTLGTSPYQIYDLPVFSPNLWTFFSPSSCLLKYKSFVVVYNEDQFTYFFLNCLCFGHHF